MQKTQCFLEFTLTFWLSLLGFMQAMVDNIPLDYLVAWLIYLQCTYTTILSKV